MEIRGSFSTCAFECFFLTHECSFDIWIVKFIFRDTLNIKNKLSLISLFIENLAQYVKKMNHHFLWE